jgi:branched-chain amino acid transport system substrate-binding protein
MKTLTKIAIAAAVSLTMASAVKAETQGVTDTEIRVGSSTDLSGIFAAFGAPSAKAAQMYFDEINAKGGVHGRKIKFIVEDHGYSLPKATQAINKLVNRDKVFTMFLGVGTPMNVASFKIIDKKKIPNVYPLSGARQMLQEPVAYHFSFAASYYKQIREAVKYFKETKGTKKVCAMYIPSDFGKEIQQGAKDEAKASGLTYAAETTHKPDEANFVGALTKLKGAGCNLVTMALGVRQTITAYATARKIGWKDADFISSSAGFHTVMAKVPGGITEGLYAAATWSDLLPRLKNPVVGAWFKKYTTATGKKLPGTGAMLGRSGAENLVRALEAAGRDLTPESFKKGMESLKYHDDITDSDVTYSADDHQGADAVIISVIKDGNWKELVRK